MSKKLFSLCVRSTTCKTFILADYDFKYDQLFSFLQVLLWKFRRHLYQVKIDLLGIIPPNELMYVYIKIIKIAFDRLY